MQVAIMQQEMKDIISKKEELKSAGERRIAGFFRQHAIRYIYEHGVFISDEEKTKIWYPDFFLPEYAVYIEYYGMAGNADYDKGIKKKTEVYASIGIDVIPIFPDTFNGEWRAYIIKQIVEILKRRMNDIEKNPQLNKYIAEDRQRNQLLDECIPKDMQGNQLLDEWGVEDVRKLYRSIRRRVF